MLRRARLTRGNTLGGVSRDPSTSRRLKNVGAPVGMTSRETKRSQCIVPSHTSNNAAMQFAWARIRGGGQPQKPVPTEEQKRRPVRKATATIAKTQAEACVTKTQHRRTQETDLKSLCQNSFCRY